MKMERNSQSESEQKYHWNHTCLLMTSGLLAFHNDDTKKNSYKSENTFFVDLNGFQGNILFDWKPPKDSQAILFLIPLISIRY